MKIFRKDEKEEKSNIMLEKRKRCKRKIYPQ